MRTPPWSYITLTILIAVVPATMAFLVPVSLQPLSIIHPPSFIAPKTSPRYKSRLCMSSTVETDPYEVLKLPRTADEKQIKRAYKRMALRYHPGFVANNKDTTSPEMRKKAKDAFAEIKWAYAQLVSSGEEGGTLLLQALLNKKPARRPSEGHYEDNPQARLHKSHAQGRSSSSSRSTSSPHLGTTPSSSRTTFNHGSSFTRSTSHPHSGITSTTRRTFTTSNVTSGDSAFLRRSSSNSSRSTAHSDFGTASSLTKGKTIDAPLVENSEVNDNRYVTKDATTAVEPHVKEKSKKEGHKKLSTMKDVVSSARIIEEPHVESGGKNKEAHNNHMSGETNEKPTFANGNAVGRTKAPAENATAAHAAAAAVMAEQQQGLLGMNESGRGQIRTTKLKKNLKNKKLDQEPGGAAAAVEASGEPAGKVRTQKEPNRERISSTAGTFHSVKSNQASGGQISETEQAPKSTSAFRRDSDASRAETRDTDLKPTQAKRAPAGLSGDLQEKKKKKTARKSKKDNDKPKRPLSAYNLFFRDERVAILNSIPATGDESESQGNNKMEGDLSLKKILHGKIEFGSLAKIIGRRWRKIEGERMEYYRKLAAQETTRYEEEMKVFRTKQNIEETKGGSSSSSQSMSSSYSGTTSSATGGASLKGSTADSPNDDGARGHEGFGSRGSDARSTARISQQQPSSSSTTGAFANGSTTSSSVSSTEDAWKRETFGNIGRGPGSSSRRRARVGDTRLTTSSSQRQPAASYTPPPRQESSSTRGTSSNSTASSSFGSPRVKDKVLLEEKPSTTERTESETVFNKAVAGAALEQELAQEDESLREIEAIQEEKVHTLDAPSVEILTPSKAEYNLEATNKTPFYATIMEYPAEIGKKIKEAHNVEVTKDAVDAATMEPFVEVKEKNREAYNLETTKDPADATAEEPPMEIKVKNKEAHNIKAAKDPVKATIEEPLVESEQKVEEVYNLGTTKKPADASIEELLVEIGENIRVAFNLEAIKDAVDATTKEPPVQIEATNIEAYNLETIKDPVDTTTREPLVEIEQKVKEARDSKAANDSVVAIIANPLVESEQKVKEAYNLDTTKEPVDASNAELLVQVGEKIKEEYNLEAIKDAVDATTEEPPMEIEEKNNEAYNLETTKDPVDATAGEPLVESEQKVKEAYSRDTTKESVDAPIEELLVEIGLKIKEEYNVETAKDLMDETTTEDLPVEVEEKSEEAHDLDAAKDSVEVPAEELLEMSEKSSFIFQFNSSQVDQVVVVQQEGSPKMDQPSALVSSLYSPVQGAMKNLSSGLLTSGAKAQVSSRDFPNEPEPSFISFPKSSTDSSEDVAVITEEPPVKVAATQQVLDKDLNDDDVTYSPPPMEKHPVEFAEKNKEPLLFSSVLKSSKDSSNEETVAISEDPAVELTASQQVLETNLNDDDATLSPPVVEHPVETPEKRKGSSLFSSMKSSNDSAQKDTIAIAVDPEVHAAATQKVLDKALTIAEKSREPSLFSILKSSKYSVEKAVAIAEDPAVEVAATQQVLDKDLKDDGVTARPVEIALKKSKEPSLFSILHSSKNTCDKVTVSIAQDPAVKTAAAQQVFDNKALNHNGVMDTLHGYMQDLAREETSNAVAQKQSRVASKSEPPNVDDAPTPSADNALHNYMQDLARGETSKRMARTKARVAGRSEPPKVEETLTPSPSGGEVTFPSAQKENIPGFLVNSFEKTETGSPEQVSSVAEPVQEKWPKRLVQKIKNVATPIKEKHLKHLVRNVKSAAKPIREKRLVRSVSKNKRPILLAALACVVSKRLVVTLMARGML